MIVEALVNALRTAQRVLVTSHMKPDGDAIGSVLAMGMMLEALGKTALLALHDPLPREFAGLPGAAQVLPPQFSPAGVDAVVALDCSSLDRLGRAWNETLAGLPLLVIDHHVTNELYGSVNWVEPACAATCQMLLDLVDRLGVPLTQPLAQCLLTGLVTDTLAFRTNNTTPETLAAGVRLLRAGAVLAEVTENILEQRSVAVLRLWGQVLADVQLAQGVIWATITRAQFAAAGSNGQDGSLSSLLIRTEGADISATFGEKLGESGEPAVECSFRARRGFDISRLAQSLGGGGHPAAGGCTVAGTAASVAAQVTPLLQQIRQEQAQALRSLPPQQGAEPLRDA